MLYDRTPGAQGEYGTLRMVLKLPPNATYAIAAKSVSYAQRLWIDGQETEPVGVPGDSIDTAVPSSRRFVEGFSPTGESTEFIFHYSAFVHADGGGLYPMAVGLVRNIVHHEQLNTFRDVAVGATLLTAMLFFFGLFLFFPKSRYLLWFSLTCGCVALYGMFAGDKTLMSLLPGLDWFIAIRLGMLLTCGMSLFSSLYLCGLFPGAANRRAVRGFTVFCATTALYICLVPPVVFTRHTVLITAAYAAFGIYILVSVVVANIRNKVVSPLSIPERWLLLAGLSVYAGFSAPGVWAHQWAVLFMGMDYPIVGMMIFTFLNILALTLGFARTERTLDAAMKAEREMEETNRTLERLNRVRSVFLTNIGHELKTPLAGITAMTQFIQAKLRRESLDVETDADMTAIIDRAEGLCDYIDRLLGQAVEQENRLDFAAVPASALLRRVAEVCEPLLLKRGNRLTLKTDKPLPPLSGVEDMLLRVLLNLVDNANRHSENSEIVISASGLPDGGTAEIRVTDYGSGIPAAIRPTVFDRGVSGDDGSGLGLAICKDIVETHGGRIYINSGRERGTEVWFTVPLARSEKE